MKAHGKEFSWNRLNHRLINDRLRDKRREISDRFNKLKNLYWSDRNPEPASRSSQTLESHHSLGDELLSEAYNIYCEAAGEFNYRESPDFIRALSQQAILPLIGELRGSEQELIRIMAPVSPSAHASILEEQANAYTSAREKEWRIRLDSEALKLEHNLLHEQLEPGRTIARLYEDLKRVTRFARGRRKTERELRSKFPDMQLWKEMDVSDLPKSKRTRFFSVKLDSGTIKRP